MTAFARQHVLLVGPFDSISGYGNDLMGMARSFLRLGADVHLSPVSVVPPIPPEVAQLLCKPIDPPYDLCIVHRDPATILCPTGAREMSRKVVGWSMWECESYPDFPSPGVASLEKRLEEFDLLLSYDEVSHMALDPYVPKETEHQILQGGYMSDWWNPLERDWSGTFRFGMLGRIADRKDPWAALKAWRIFKEKNPDADAEFHIKTYNRYLHPGIEAAYGVRIHYAFWNQKQVEAFYGQLHCLLAPSRGEGKNLPALESMSTGIPVIATNYGGHKNWLSDEYAYKLDYAPFETENGRCAAASVEHLAELMDHVYHNRGEAQEKGRIASSVIPRMLDWDHVLEKLGDVVKDIKGREPIPKV